MKRKSNYYDSKHLLFKGNPEILLLFTSLEIVQCAYRLLLDCFQTLLSHTHMAITLLMIFMVIWLLDLRFDTRLFAILVCLVGYMRMWTIDTFNYAVRNLVHYLAARRRIEVTPYRIKIISLY